MPFAICFNHFLTIFASHKSFLNVRCVSVHLVPCKNSTPNHQLKMISRWAVGRAFGNIKARNTSNNFTRKLFEMYPPKVRPNRKTFYLVHFNLWFISMWRYAVNGECWNFHINKFTTLIPFAVRYEKLTGSLKMTNKIKWKNNNSSEKFKCKRDNFCWAASVAACRSLFTVYYCATNAFEWKLKFGCLFLYTLPIKLSNLPDDLFSNGFSCMPHKFVIKCFTFYVFTFQPLNDISHSEEVRWKINWKNENKCKTK